MSERRCTATEAYEPHARPAKRPVASRSRESLAEGLLVSSLPHSYLLAGGLAALAMVRLFFRVIRLVIVLAAIAVLVVATRHSGEWRAFAQAVGIR
jgi:predicted lipid-binding transport protein (Tim44 family)